MKRNGNIFLIVQLFVCQIFSPKVLPLPETVLCTEQSFSHPTPFSPPPPNSEKRQTEECHSRHIAPLQLSRNFKSFCATIHSLIGNFYCKILPEFTYTQFKESVSRQLL